MYEMNYLTPRRMNKAKLLANIVSFITIVVIGVITLYIFSFIVPNQPCTVFTEVS